MLIYDLSCLNGDVSPLRSHYRRQDHKTSWGALALVLTDIRKFRTYGSFKGQAAVWTCVRYNIIFESNMQ
jgi:hypothetical protein